MFGERVSGATGFFKKLKILSRKFAWERRAENAEPKKLPIKATVIIRKMTFLFMIYLVN